MKATILLLLLLQVQVLHGETLYWKGGSGHWHDPLHWSLSSGGLSCGRIPTPVDDVEFDAASFSIGNDTLFSRLPIACRNMTWTSGAAGAKWIWATQEDDPIHYQDIFIHGSLTLAPDMVLDLPGRFVFAATTTDHTITTNGNILPVLRFNGNGGSWSFQDDLMHTAGIQLVRGNLIANGNILRTDHFLSNEPGIATKSLDLTDAILELTGSGEVWHSGYGSFQFNGSGSLIRITNPGNTFFSGPGGPFNIELSEPAAHLNTGGTFGDMVNHGSLRLSNGSTVANLLMHPGSTFSSPGTVTITGSVDAQGLCWAPVHFISGGFTKDDGSILVDNVVLENFSASGTASFTATNSADLGGNMGWNIDVATSQTYYWIGGSGNWSDPQNWSLNSGGSAGICLPGPADDVVFDANSFAVPEQSVVLDKLTRVRNVLFDENILTPILTGDQVFEVHGSMTLSSQLTYDHNGVLRFASKLPEATITSNGCIIHASTVRFQGLGSWVLADEFQATGELLLAQGTLNTNDQHVQALRFFIPQEPPLRQLILGNSLIEMSGYSGWSVSSTAIIDAGTSVIKIQSGFSSGPHSYHRVEAMDHGNISGSGTYEEFIFHKNGTITSGGTFEQLTFSPGHNYTFTGTAPLITGNWEAVGGCMGAIHITGTVILQGTATLHNVTLQQLIVQGNPVTATNAMDLGFNNGVTFEPWTPSSLYWIGDSGDWNDPQHWSFTSGGASSGCVPSPLTDVIFDANSFTSTGESINITLNSKCHSMIWQAGGVIAGDKDLELYGDLVLHPDIVWAQQGKIILRSRNTATITSNGAEFDGILEINRAVNYQLLDDLNGTENSRITLDQGGKLDANGNDIRFGRCNSLMGGILQLGNSTMELTAGMEPGGMATFSVGWSINMVPGEYTIRLTHPQAVFNGSGYNYERVVFSATTGTVSIGASHVNEAEFNGDASLSVTTIGELSLAPGHHYTGNSTILEELTALGGCDSWISMRNMNLNTSTATISLDHVILENVQFTGGAAEVATNSVDAGNNSGVTIETVMPKTLYWIGGEGEWHDAAHWSETSGGTSAGCMPTPQDDVFFDALSFTAEDQLVSVNGVAFFKNMTWTPDVLMPEVTGNGELSIAGSMVLAENMLVSHAGVLRFSSTLPGNIISLSEHWLNGHLEFRGTGEWTLNGPLRTTGFNEIKHFGGALVTNGHDVDIWNYRTQTYSATAIPGWELHLGSSHVHLRGNNAAWWNNANAGMLLDAGTSIIELSGNTATMRAGNAQYNEVRFTGTAGNCSIEDVIGHFQRLSCAPGTGQFIARGTVGDLILPRGRDIQLNITLLGEITTIEGDDEFLYLNGTTITKTTGSVCVDKAVIHNVTASGGAEFIAGRSTLTGTTTGWLQDDCYPDLLLDHTPLTICQGGEITFMNASSGYILEQEWQFEGGDPITSDELSPTVIFAEPGSYPVNIMITYADTVITATLPEMVIVGPMDPIIITNDGSALMVNISDAQYQWIDCLDDSVIEGANGQEFSPEMNGNYAVQVITSDGCNGISECLPFITVGASAADLASSFRIVPNPNQGSFMVHLPNTVANASIVLMDATGKVLYQRSSISSAEWIDLQAAPGLYIIQLRTNDHFFQQRVIIE